MEQQVVRVAADGRMTLPAAVRRALDLKDGADRVSINVTDGVAFLRPAIVIPRDDAWAYKPEHITSVKRARAQVKEGKLAPFPRS